VAVNAASVEAKGGRDLVRPLADAAVFPGRRLLVLLFGGVAVARFYRRCAEVAPPLSPEERQRLSAMLGEEAKPEGSR
jgi:hypothetical protein